VPEIIDLSQEIFPGMPVFPGLPEVNITMHVSHEQWDKITDSDIVSPAVNRLELGEHTGTHVDAINHMARQYRGQSIDTMPLTMFYTDGICLDLSYKGLRELIEAADLERSLSKARLKIKQGDTVLLYTDHYRRAFGTDDWHNGPGVSAEAARWLGQHKIAAFGVETMAPVCFTFPTGGPSLWRIGYALREHDQFTSADRSRAFSLHWPASQNTWRHRLACPCRCCF
jgi:kynurenine formamidase